MYSQYYEKICFSFPKDTQLRDKWIRAAGRPNFIPTVFSRVCSNHFSKNDYCKRFGQVLLVKDAVPSNSFAPNNSEDISLMCKRSYKKIYMSSFVEDPSKIMYV